MKCIKTFTAKPVTNNYPFRVYRMFLNLLKFCKEIEKPFLGFLLHSFQPGGFINSVTFRAIKGKGAEGDIAIDELHFLETCDMKPKGMVSFVYYYFLLSICYGK